MYVFDDDDVVFVGVVVDDDELDDELGGVDVDGLLPPLAVFVLPTWRLPFS